MPEGTITEILAVNRYSMEYLVFQITTYYIQVRGSHYVNSTLPVALLVLILASLFLP
jgi:spore maturation protein SpmB